MKKELLAPVGNKECLYQAVFNGADAVYLAGNKFGARAYAKNFTNEELKEAVDFAHLYGVLVYVAVNTVIFESELEECLNYVAFLYTIGVDAIIVQDIGLMKLVHDYIPEMVIHASTQAHTHNIEQIKFLERLGVKRVVLAREMGIEKVNSLETDMELEIFIHGALCISYSGQCLFSSGLYKRSGNRGECAGLCRLPYNLVEKEKVVIRDKYLLSPKEFNSTAYIKALKECQAISFKIEGRMKSPEYVGYVTRMYRKLLDKQDYVLSEKEIFNLKSLYNRDFTKGYLWGEKDKDFISLNSSNHQGVKIGEVVGFNEKRIKIKLSHELVQEDAIRLPGDLGMYVNFLYDEKWKLINKAAKGDIVYIDNKVGLKKTGDVKLTISKKLMMSLKNMEEKKINIIGYVYAHVNEELEVKFSDGVNEVMFRGEVVSEASKRPVGKERIREIFEALGGTPFKMESLELDVDDNIFVVIGVLKEIRRNLVQELIKKRIYVNRNVNLRKYEINDVKRDVKEAELSALVRNEEQLKICLEEDVDYIYVTDKELYEKYKRNKVYLRLERVMSDYLEYSGCNLLVGETGSLKYLANNKIVSDYYFNVTNSGYVNYLDSLGVKIVTISPEVAKDNLESLLKRVRKAKVEVIVYGTLEYMIMKYNLKKNMGLGEEKYYLENKNLERFPIISDKFTHLMSNKKRDWLKEASDLRRMGVDVFRLELFDEGREEVRNIIKAIKKAS